MQLPSPFYRGGNRGLQKLTCLRSLKSRPDLTYRYCLQVVFDNQGFLLLFLVCLKEMREEKKAPSLIRTVPSNFIQRFYRKMIFVIITLFYIRVSAQKLQGEIWYLLFMKMKSYRKKITFPSWLNPKFLDNFCMNQKYVRELFRI